jgi:hypothetical protein
MPHQAWMHTKDTIDKSGISGIAIQQSLFAARIEFAASWDSAFHHICPHEARGKAICNSDISFRKSA